MLLVVSPWPHGGHDNRPRHLRMQPSMAGGGGTAPPPVVPVDVPRPVAPQVTTLLVTESVPVPANGTAAIIGGELFNIHT